MEVQFTQAGIIFASAVSLGEVTWANGMASFRITRRNHLTTHEHQNYPRVWELAWSQNARAISRSSVFQPVPGGDDGNIPGTKAGFNPLVSEDVHQVAISLGVENYDGRQGHQAPPLVNAKYRPDGFPGNHPDRPFCYHDLPQPSPTTMDGSPSTSSDPLPVLSVILPRLSLFPTIRQLPVWYQTCACSRRGLGIRQFRFTNHRLLDDAQYLTLIMIIIIENRKNLPAKKLQNNLKILRSEKIFPIKNKI